MTKDTPPPVQAIAPNLTPLQHPQPATRVQFGLGAVLQYSNTPSLRGAGFEDEDDDEDENEAPCEGGRVFKSIPGVKTPGLVLLPLRRGRNRILHGALKVSAYWATS